MPDDLNEQDLNDRLRIVESMIAEGRRTTEHWSWTFVLWGCAYMVAIAWSTWGHSWLAWPVTMATAGVLTWLGSVRETPHKPETTAGRAVGSIWMALGGSMFVLFGALGFSGHLTDAHIFVAVAASFLGMANAASGLLLRWRAQLACGVTWLAAAALGSFGTENQALVVFLLAIFLCNIVFGIYGMSREARERRTRGALHA